MITIKTRISLDFLGEEYNDSYLIFNSIPLRELSDIQTKITSASSDESSSLALLAELISDRFVEGKINQNGKLVDVVKEDLLDLPANVITEAIGQMIGHTDPKS